MKLRVRIEFLATRKRLWVYVEGDYPSSGAYLAKRQYAGWAPQAAKRRGFKILTVEAVTPRQPWAGWTSDEMTRELAPWPDDD